MTLERIFSNKTSITIDDIFQSILNEKVDALISEIYDTSKVNFTDSSIITEEEVA